MKAEYKDGQTPGTGYILLEDLGGLAQIDGIAIQRGADQNFLAARRKNPWVGEIFYFPCQPIFKGDAATIEIGPEIVDELDPQEQYAIKLKGIDGRFRLGVTSVTHSPSGSLGNTAQAAEPAPAAPQPTAAVRPSQAAPQPSQAAPQPEAQQAEPLQMPSQPQAASGRHKFFLAAIIGALLLAAIAWYFYSHKTPEQPSAPAAEPAQTPPPPPAQPQSAEEQVRQFFKGGKISPSEAVALARKLPANTAADKDAIYRLWYFAAENGEPAAFLPYAKTLDPSQPNYGSIQKNAMEAWRFYEKGREAEPQKAEELMTHLRGWLSKEAQNNNAQAKEWLLQIDQPR